MRRFFYIILLAGYLLTGCGSLASARANEQSALPFVLVTAAPNASPTPTPFQPLPLNPTGTAPASGEAQPAIDPATPTATLPAPTETQPPTIDPNLLINTVVPFSTIDPSGANSQ